jgi:hypothetical protein
MNKSLAVILGVVLLAGAWFLASPLIFDRTVDEGFDFVSDGHVDMKAVMMMSDDEQQALMPEIMDAAARAPHRSISESMPVDTPQAVAQGEFVDADAIHKGSGHAKVFLVGVDRYIVRLEDFRATNGPDLVVYLAKHPSPTQGSHVKDGGYISLGKLKGNVGNQNYAVPGGTDIADYNSIVIWCELFGVLFSAAALTGT